MSHIYVLHPAKFQEAERKALESFFHNQVWEFDMVDNAQAEQTLIARVLTNWSKKLDGSPGAKAKFIVREYQDYCALYRGLDISSLNFKELLAEPDGYLSTGRLDSRRGYSLTSRSKSKEETVGEPSC